jgi:phosphoribosylglycinamide formyltransferase-1
MLRLAILESGGGSNLQSILDAGIGGNLKGVKPVLVIADRQCPALDRGFAAGLDTVLLDRKVLGNRLSPELDRLLEKHRIDIAALAGWLSILDAQITQKRAGRILNIHPSLLPSHGGPGMYGLRVHEAVLAAGETESGCTVHLVSQGVDEGLILGQFRVPVHKDDTTQELAARILVQEHKLYPRVISELAVSIG